jgi:hypothetical protein
MDFPLYLRVLWRFRLIVLAGLCLGFTLAFFSYVRVSFGDKGPMFSYRQSEVWESEARLFVTQRGFPWGRTAPQYLPSGADRDAPPIPESDPSRLASFATLYSEFAKGDFVQSIVGRANARLVVVEPVPAPPLSSPPILPLISVRALGPSPQASALLAQRTANALLTFVHRQQNDARIPADARVRVEPLSRPNRQVLVSGRGKTIPVIVFVAVLMAACGLAFVLENLRPMPKRKPILFAEPAPGETGPPAPAEAPLRSA